MFFVILNILTTEDVIKQKRAFLVTFLKNEKLKSSQLSQPLFNQAQI